VTFTAVVTAPGYQGTPTGTVTFTIDGQAKAPVALAVVGGHDEAQFTTSALAAGSHTVSAAYSGDAKVADSSGSLPAQTINPAPPKSTTTTLVSSANPSTVGQAVTFTAVVTAPGYQGTPTGTVTFTIDGQAEAPVTVALVGGQYEARFTTSALAAGTHTVSAAYSGDAHVAGSSAALPTQTVNAPTAKATTTALATSANPSTVGQTVTFTATVSPGTSAGTPTGTVTFTIDGTAEPPVPLRMVGGRDQAAFSVATLAPGAHTIVAKYNGDATFAASAVPHPLTQVVAAPTPTPTGTPPDRPVTTPVPPPPIVESLKRFGTRARRTSLVLAFSAPLDPTRADNPGNYRIVGPHHRPVRIRSVVYDPAAETVTLYPRTKINLHRTYGVTVIGTGPGGVADSRDVLLDGVGDGRAGSDFVTTLTRSNLVVAPAAGPKPASGAR
jgi:hypothetical protein